MDAKGQSKDAAPDVKLIAGSGVLRGLEHAAGVGRRAEIHRVQAHTVTRRYKLQISDEIRRSAALGDHALHFIEGRGAYIIVFVAQFIGFRRQFLKLVNGKISCVIISAGQLHGAPLVNEKEIKDAGADGEKH